MSGNIDQQTVESFGAEWSQYDQSGMADAGLCYTARGHKLSFFQKLLC